MDYDIGVDEGAKHQPKRIKNLLKSLRDFEPKTELDRKLLLGIIERGEPHQKNKTKIATT